MKRRSLDDSRLKWWAGTAIGVALLALLIDQPMLLVLALLMAASVLVLWRWRGRALPLVALAWAAASHTASMAGWTAAYDAIFAKYGFIVSNDLDEAVAFAKDRSGLPLDD